MKLSLISALMVACIAGGLGDDKVDGDTHYSSLLADLWLEGADVIRILWRDCSKKLIDVKDVIDHKEYFPKFIRCMKRKTLRALDRSLSTDTVPLAEGVNLVRFEMVDKSGNVMSSENETSYWTEQELEEGEWRTLALHRLAKVLRTHVIKFDLDSAGKTVEKAEYRGRRRHQMMTMMMFGIVSIGMVFIPMGFQFLAVLGGKALLLAKMALILASIQGLKKIATSPVNYGFYHTFPPPLEHLERSLEDWPSLINPGTPPSTMGRHNHWANSDNSITKFDRKSEPRSLDGKKIGVSTWKPELPKSVKKELEPRLYPVFLNTPETSQPYVTSIDAPTPLADLTTRPGEVQADFSVDMPYNGLHFQSPTTVVPS